MELHTEGFSVAEPKLAREELLRRDHRSLDAAGTEFSGS